MSRSLVEVVAADPAVHATRAPGRPRHRGCPTNLGVLWNGTERLAAVAAASVT